MASRSLCLPPARTHFWTDVARGGTGGGLLAEEVRDELHHPGVGEQRRRGVVRDQAAPRARPCAALDEEVGEGAAQLVCGPQCHRLGRAGASLRAGSRLQGSIAPGLGQAARRRSSASRSCMAVAGPRRAAARRSLAEPARHGGGARRCRDLLPGRSGRTVRSAPMADPQGAAEPEADAAGREPEQPLEHGSALGPVALACRTRPRSRRAALAVPLAMATALITGLEKADVGQAGGGVDACR